VQLVNYAILSFVARIRTERGQDLLEYALLGGLIAAALLAIGVSVALTGGVQALADNVKACIDFDSGTPCNPPG
jgi:Flp pilus assembly pilin Flp